MFKFVKKINHQEVKLYNKILTLSRNKLFYTKFRLNDTFQNRIYLIFIHISFLFIKIKKQEKTFLYKNFYQALFDLIFEKIELNMREIGHGDTAVNKNMRVLVKNFYNILLICDGYIHKNKEYKKIFLRKYLTFYDDILDANIIDLIQYFEKYHAFCFDLSSDSVLKGELNFTYK